MQPIRVIARLHSTHCLRERSTVTDSSPEGIAFQNHIESIRKRTSMYVGSTTQFGFINYLVCPVALLVSLKPRHICVTAADGFEISCDVPLEISEKDGQMVPFECASAFTNGAGLDGVVLNALSVQLTVRITNDTTTQVLQYVRGIRTAHSTSPASGDVGTSFCFQPDEDILKVTSLPATIFESFLRRLSFLNEGITFSLTADGGTQSWQSDQGMLDLFTAIIAPYQIMHEPLQFRATDGDLELEVVMAFQSWVDDDMLCFMNRGRAVAGGTHEEGLRNGLRRLKRRLKLDTQFRGDFNGVVGVASIIYPHAVWEGCIKEKVGNPELVKMVSQLVLDNAFDWIDRHPHVADQLQQMEIFQHPDFWMTKK